METDNLDKVFEKINKVMSISTHKEMILIDVSKAVRDFVELLISIRSNNNSETEKFSGIGTNLFIHSLMYINTDNIREMLFDLLLILRYKFEPEEEELIVGFLVEVMENILKLYPVLKMADVIVPFDTVQQDNKIKIKTVACFKNK